jgi:hypothetical protein
MPPPLKPSPFPKSQFTKVWDEAILWVSRSPLLAKVKSSETWQGGAREVRPFALEELPSLRIAPAAGAFTWADECRFNGPFILEVKLGVKGTRASDLFDFWQAVAHSLTPTPLFYDTFQPLGVYCIEMSAPALRPVLICENQAIQADGYITLKMNVSI